MTDSVLPCGRVVSEVEEHGGEPVVDVIQRALLVWRLQYRPSYHAGVGVQWSNVVVFVTLNARDKIWP